MTTLVGAPPSDLGAQAIFIGDDPSRGISGWFARGASGSGGVLLLHGVRSDRRQMLARSRALAARGYSVLMLDLPAHGESAGSRISFGFREAEGVRAGLQFLRSQLPYEKTAVIGVSLGAAAFVLADMDPAPDAVVLESMYPTIEEAIANRLRLYAGALGAPFAPLLFTQIPLRLGISTDQLHPIDRVATLRTPVLIAGGTEDRHTTLAETQRIFAAANAPKQLWLVEGAGHVDLYDFSPKAYGDIVFGFIDRHLQLSD